jgi:hypothetical protein
MIGEEAAIVGQGNKWKESPLVLLCEDSILQTGAT